MDEESVKSDYEEEIIEKSINETDDDDGDEYTEDISIVIGEEDENNFYNTYDPTNNVSSNILTKYEKTKIIYERISHLSLGSKPYINSKNNTDLYSIALEELNKIRLPYIIKRNVGNKDEYWKLEDLIII